MRHVEFIGSAAIIALSAVLITFSGCNKEEATAESQCLLPGKFSVAEGKQVRFTRGNLYWDGSTFHLESSQTAYPASWDTKRVGHFFWTKTTTTSYAASYNDGQCTISDHFFADGSDYEHTLTVDGQGGLYALTCGDTGEWSYLFSKRTNALNLYKKHVTVNGVQECLVLAPDGFTGTLAESYDASAWKAAEESGIVCLPPAGYRNGITVCSQGSAGGYLSATPSSSDANLAYGVYFPSPDVFPTDCERRSYGYSVRLVSTVSR